MAENVAAGRPLAGLVLAVAAWMRYVAGIDETGAPIDVRDPLADRLRALSDGAADPAGKVAALLEVREIFPPGLAADPAVRNGLTAAYAGLVARGARKCAEEVADRAVRQGSGTTPR
jgi:fructuronate reductase